MELVAPRRDRAPEVESVDPASNVGFVTGEVQGERPWSKVKIALAVTAAVILLVVILVVYNSAKSGGT